MGHSSPLCPKLDFLIVKGIVQVSDNQLLLSAASGWETALLWHLKRVELPDQPQRFIPEALQKLNITPLPIGFDAAISAATLTPVHRDPFDRIIIVEAIEAFGRE